MAPLCKVIVCPETKRLDTPPVSSSHGWGKLGEVEKVLEVLEKTRLAAAEVNEGEDWNWEVVVPLPLVVLFSNSCVAKHYKDWIKIIGVMNQPDPGQCQC